MINNTLKNTMNINNILNNSLTLRSLVDILPSDLHHITIIDFGDIFSAYTGLTDCGIIGETNYTMIIDCGTI